MRRDMLLQGSTIESALPELRSAAAALTAISFDRVVITGSGDSYIAAVAVEALFQRHLDVPVIALPALDASRYRRPKAADLTLVISVSGEVSRGIEVAKAARAAGAMVVAVTSSAQSSLAQSSDLVVATPAPIDRSIPHCRDYSLTLLALACALEALCRRRFGELDALPLLVGALVEPSMKEAASLPATSGRTWFLGAGPDRATAMYGSMKYWEAAGLESWWDDLEEFGHGSQLMAKPGDRAVVIAAGSGCQRGIEMAPGLERMGLDVVLVGGSAFAGLGRTHLATSDRLDSVWHPFVASIPLQGLAYAEASSRRLDVAIVLDGQAHGPVYDEVHAEWTRQSRIVTADDSSDAAHADGVGNEMP